MAEHLSLLAAKRAIHLSGRSGGFPLRAGKKDVRYCPSKASSLFRRDQRMVRTYGRNRWWKRTRQLLTNGQRSSGRNILRGMSKVDLALTLGAGRA